MRKMLMFVFVLFPAGLFCQFSGGTGTFEDPYQIATPEQFNELRNYDGEMYFETFFILTGDIDLSGYGNWAPIGTFFSAVIDGNNHKITGLLIDRPNTDNIGIFGSIHIAKISNFIIEGGSVSGQNFVGAISGSMCSSASSITNCHSTCDVLALNNAGGLVGNNAGTISNSSVSAVVISKINVISYPGQLHEGGEYAGGITAINSGNISTSYSTGTVKGFNYTGGLIGNNSGSVSNSYSISDVKDISMEDASFWDIGMYIGGFSGNNSGSISKSYYAGTVTAAVTLVGGFTGSGSNSTNCFWDVNTSGRTTSSSGTGLTTAEMKTLSTYTDAGWDFYGESANGTNDIWNISSTENDGYPSLTWEGPSGIQDNEIQVQAYTLLQNYPNPFNPVTTISYALPKAALVELNVYNLNGQLVQSLVNGKIGKGQHHAEFNADDLTSGLYIYNLKIDGKSVQSRKMMLIK
ncbi:MAG: T9SS type A sorting domain-containing protein [Candidatus Delongbacteria bacterium]|jgi:hypothetical protein|nr:T9SS type A sorting domain-containing protein [Candidatus Delongbacteria bacterium]